MDSRSSRRRPLFLRPKSKPTGREKPIRVAQEDVNGEKLTVKKWWIFGADFFTVYADFSRFVRDINGEKKHLLIDNLFHG